MTHLLCGVVDDPRRALFHATRDPWDAGGRRHQFGECALIAAAIAGGATAATNIYSAKKAAKVNEEAINAQATSEREARAAQLASQAEELKLARETAATGETARKETLGVAENARKEDLAAAERARVEDLAYRQKLHEDAVAMDKARYEAYVTANTPYWQAGQKVFGNLLDLAHVAQPAGAPGGAVGTPVAGPASAGAAVAPLATPTPVAGGPVTPNPTVPTGGSASLADLARLATATTPTPGAAVDPLARLKATSQGFAVASQPRMTAPAPSNGLSLLDLLKLVSQARTPAVDMNPQT